MKPKKKDEPHYCQTFTRKGDFLACTQCGQWIFIG